jgi:hypothetical protein
MSGNVLDLLVLVLFIRCSEKVAVAYYYFYKWL